MQGRERGEKFWFILGDRGRGRMVQLLESGTLSHKLVCPESVCVCLSVCRRRVLDLRIRSINQL